MVDPGLRILALSTPTRFRVARDLTQPIGCVQPSVVRRRRSREDSTSGLQGAQPRVGSTRSASSATQSRRCRAREGCPRHCRSKYQDRPIAREFDAHWALGCGAADLVGGAEHVQVIPHRSNARGLCRLQICTARPLFGDGSGYEDFLRPTEESDTAIGLLRESVAVPPLRLHQEPVGPIPAHLG
jgi:hypothetical protein